MVAAPQYATFVFMTNGGTNIAVDAYLSDVANGAVNFDSGTSAASTSETFWKAPVSGRLVDFSIKTGMTDTTCARITINGSPTKSVVRYANHLNTMALRPPLNIPIAAGENLGAVQLA